MTMADISREAGVAIQTIFNNFASKEELFFDGRTPWVEGPAAAVRGRPAGTDPLQALRDHLVASVHEYVQARSSQARARFLKVVEDSPVLQAHERALTFETETRLRAALEEAWSADARPQGETTAALVAATWVSVTRTLLATQRHIADDSVDAGRLASGIASLSALVLETVRLGLDHFLPDAAHLSTPSGLDGGPASSTAASVVATPVERGPLAIADEDLAQQG